VIEDFSKKKKKKKSRAEQSRAGFELETCSSPLLLQDGLILSLVLLCQRVGEQDTATPQGIFLTER
jgi:hypothetical protein